MQLDCLSAEAFTSLGVYKAWFDFDWEGSERELRRALALNPNYAFAHDQLVTAYLASAYAMAGDRPRAMATLGELKRMSPRGNVAPLNLALIYRGLGDHARALDYLEQAYAANSQHVFWLKVDPLWDPLRSEPRFIALMKRLNFSM